MERQEDNHTQMFKRIMEKEFDFTYEGHTVPLRELKGDAKQKAIDTAARMRAKSHEMNEKFRNALAETYGVLGNPKEPLLWRLTWDLGHSSGYAEVLHFYDEMVELVK